MRSLLLALIALAVAACGAVLGTSVALACSCGNECDSIVHNADLIVEGRVTGWEPAEGYERFGQFVPVVVRLEPVRVFKGIAPNPVPMVDIASLILSSQDGGQRMWAGAAGACGSFDDDPTGLYIIAALYRDDLGNYRMGRPATVFVGRDPGGTNYDFIVAKLTANVGPPQAGTGRVEPHEAPGRALALAGTALMALSLALWTTSRRAPSG